MNTIQLRRSGTLVLALAMGIGCCGATLAQQSVGEGASTAAHRGSKSAFVKNSMLPRGEAPTMRAVIEATHPTAGDRGAATGRSVSKVRPASFAAYHAAPCECEQGSVASACGPACTAACPPTKRGLSLFCLFDGIAGGIEHVLGLESPACRTQGCDGLQCDQLGCDRLPALPVHDFSREPLQVEPLWPTAPEIIEHGPLTTPRAGDAPKPAPAGEVAPRPLLPAPQVPDSLSDPFEDDQAWLPGRDPSIQRSAYFE